MKQLTIIFTLFLLSMTAVLATSGACYNQDGAPYCGINDQTCTYMSASNTPEADTDGDGWSNSCDAFADNKNFIVDYDGDGVGAGFNTVYDCDDLDADNTNLCGNVDLLLPPPPPATPGSPADVPSETNTTQDNSTQDTTTDTNTNTKTTSSSGGSHHSSSSYSSPTVETDNQTNQTNKSELVFENTFDSPTITPTNTTNITLQQPSQNQTNQTDDTTNQLTGAVIGSGNTIITWPIWFLIGIIVVGLVSVVVYNKQK